MSATTEHPSAQTLDSFVDLTALGVGIIALAQGSDKATLGSPAFAAYERGLSKLRAQVRAVAAMLPTDPCSCEGEFELRRACMEWVKSVDDREALEKSSA